jgi:hypothetical protein
LRAKQISLTINEQRYPLNWDTTVRWTINGTYLKQYTYNQAQLERKNLATHQSSTGESISQPQNDLGQEYVVQSGTQSTSVRSEKTKDAYHHMSQYQY